MSKPEPPRLQSGELLGLGQAPKLPAGSVEVRGAELAQYRVTSGYRLFLSPQGKFYLVEDATADGSDGIVGLHLGVFPPGARVVDPSSVGVSIVPRGFAVIMAADGQILLSPSTPEARQQVLSITENTQ